MTTIPARTASTRKKAVRITIPLILAAFLIAGFVMTAIGLWQYQDLMRTNYRSPSFKGGFVIFSSPWTRIEGNAQVYIKIYNIRTNPSTATLNVLCSFDTNDTTTTKVLYGMQLPYNFSTLMVDVKMWSRSRPQGEGEGLGNPFFLNQSRGVDSANGLFYFWVIIDRSDRPFSPWDKFAFTTTMTLDQPLYQKSYTTYELITQFDSAAFTTFPPAVTPEIPGTTFSYFTPANSGNYFLEVAPPERSKTESNPSSDSIILSESRTWYYWDVSTLILSRRNGPAFFGTAILADFEMSDLVEQRERLFFQAGILFGVGIPAAMTSAIELLREVGDWKARH
jgi:hypothetical protein